jgi:iron complex outermembrane receptor protein
MADEQEKDADEEHTMDTVIVSSTKTKEKRKDIPNSVVYKDSLDIEESPAIGVGDFLSGELGVDWRTRGNYGGAAEEIHIRGMSGDATQVLVNGITFNSPSLGGADVGRIPTNNIDHIEVIKGSGSVLYGSGAMGGTVNIITKSPERDKIDLKAGAGYGTQDTYELSFEHGMFLIGDFGYYLTATRKKTDGLRDNSNLRHNDATLKLLYEPGDFLNITLYGDYVGRSYGAPGPASSREAKDFYFNGTQVYSEESSSLLNNGSDEDWHAGAKIKTRPLKWLGISVRGDYSEMENYYYSRWYSPGFPPFIPQTLPGAKTWTINKVMHGEGSIDVNPFKGATLLMGGEYKTVKWVNKTYDLDSEGEKVPDTFADMEAHARSKGAYGEAQYRPCRYVKFLAGARYEDHSEFGNKTLPRFGLIINPFETTAIKASHGRHFKAPTMNDLFWDQPPYMIGNPDLEPEVGWHSDVTLEQSLFEDKVFITGSYFHWDINDKIQWGSDDQGIWEPQNLRKFEADGFEAGVRLGPFWGITLGGNYTYTDATEENKEFYYQDWMAVPAEMRFRWNKRRAAYTPKHQFKGILTYRNKCGFTFSGIARFVGNRYFYVDEQIAPPMGVDYETVKYKLESYWTVDVKVQQRFLRHFILSVEGTNLLNEEYDTFFGTFTDYDKIGPWGSPGLTTLEAYPGAGRAVFGSITVEY